MGYLIKIALLFAPGGIPILLLLFLYKLVKGKEKENMKKTISVYYLEKRAMYDLDEIPSCIEEALGQPLEEAGKEIPINIGHTEETGWFITMSGQGPFIFWMEHEDRGTYGMASDGRRDHWVTITKE